MSANNIDVLIAVLTERSVRLDKHSGELRILLRSERSTVAEAAEAALKAAPFKRGARVLVCSSDFFTQAVRLPALQTRGLSQADLLSALIFEVEPFSNISRNQGRTGFAESGESAGMVTWQVFQIANADLAAITAAVRAAGGKVAGLTPADDALAAAPEQDLPGLLEAAAEAAASHHPSIPLIAPAPAGFAANRLAAAGAALLAVTALACAIHYASANARIAQVRSRVKTLDELESVNAEAASAIRAMEAKISALEAAKASREAGEKDLVRYRAAWESLIRHLPEACGDDVVIRAIESPSPFVAEIEGSSVSDSGPGGCMAKLAKSAGTSGWRISPELLRRDGSAGASPLRFRFVASLERETAGGPAGQPHARTAPASADLSTNADAWRHEL